jgi:hypothetical protein
MNPAIYQFKLSEDSSPVSVADQIGLWDHAVKASKLEQMPADVAMEACAVAVNRLQVPRCRGLTACPRRAVRAWASSNRIELSTRGRIPADAIDQYRAAGN